MQPTDPGPPSRTTSYVLRTTFRGAREVPVPSHKYTTQPVEPRPPSRTRSYVLRTTFRGVREVPVRSHRYTTQPTDPRPPSRTTSYVLRTTFRGVRVVLVRSHRYITQPTDPRPPSRTTSYVLRTTFRGFPRLTTDLISTPRPNPKSRCGSMGRSAPSFAASGIVASVMSWRLRCSHTSQDVWSTDS